MFLKPDNSLVNNSYIVNVLNNMDLSDYITGMTVQKLNQEKLLSIKIPVPSLETQNQMVEELDNNQKIIDGCRQVIENYKPSIVDPKWEKVDLGDLCKIYAGKLNANAAVENIKYLLLVLKTYLKLIVMLIIVNACF